MTTPATTVSDAEDILVGAVTAATRAAADTFATTIQAQDQAALDAANALTLQLQAALAASEADDATQKDLVAQIQAAFDAYKLTHPDPTPPPPPPAAVAFGSAINSTSVYADLKADGVVCQASRVFYKPGVGLPAKWSDDARLPQSGIAVVSHKDEVDPAKVTAFYKSKPDAVTAYGTWFHEVENNISASFTLAHFRSESVIQCAAIAAGGGIPGLILTGYTGSDAAIKAGGRPVSDYFVGGSHRWFGVDFYSDRDEDNIIQRTTAFALANKIAWAITESGMATKNGTDAQRAAYAARIRQKALAASPPPFTVDWWTDTSNANFLNPLTPAVAKAFFGVS